jgi:hypothetical protein
MAFSLQKWGTLTGPSTIPLDTILQPGMGYY